MKTPRPNGHQKYSLGIGTGRIRWPRSPQLNVTVTQQHIDEARIRDSSHCMTGAAILAARPDAFKIAVDLQTIRFSDRVKRLRYVWLTPRIVQENIVLWDQGEQVQPFSFRLSGAHVTAMYKRKELVTGVRTIGTGTGQVPVLVEVNKPKKVGGWKRDNTPANRARQGLRLEQGGSKIPTRVGGRRPPLNVPFSRRRAFGLRALVR